MKNNIFKSTKVLLILLSLVVFSVAGAIAQEGIININKKSLPMSELLAELRQQSGYDFVFTTSKIDFNRPVQSHFVNATLEEVLGQTFPLKSGVFYVFQNKTIVFIDIDKAKFRTVHGFVRSADTKKPVVGATVSVVGQEITAQSNMSGEFFLAIPEYARTLETRFMGFETSFVAITGSSDYNIDLSVKSEKIDEVVITGIFERDAKNFTGASTSISGTDLKKVSAQNVFSAISAYDPSFRIVPNNLMGGSINQLPEIQMRGQNSFPNLSGQLSSNPNQPLFILDGFEVNLQRIMDMDMNLIQNITLLKDASATAIYGSRGANGVMVITSVAPKAGKVQVSVNNDFGLTTPVLSVYNMLNASEKLDFEKRVGRYDYPESPQYQNKMDELYNDRLKAVLSGVNTDWLKVPTQIGYNNRTSLLLQGGDAAIRYGVQVNGDFQNGVMKGQNRKNYAGQFDLNYTVKKIQFRNSMRIFQNKANESPYGNFSTYVNLNPYWTPYDENGVAKKMVEDFTVNNTRFEMANPVYDATLHSVNKSQYFGLSNNFQVRFTPSPIFYVESSLSLNKQNASADQFYSAENSKFNNVADANQKGSYTARNENTFSYESTTTANLNYTKDKNQLFSTLSFNIQSSENNFYSIMAQGFPFERLDNLLFAKQYEQNGRPTGDESTTRRLGLMYSGSYSYDNRFLTDVSIRRDGSSQFGADKRFGTFWSAGLGWNIHNEKFFRQSDIVNRLKIRASYGNTGSLNIPAYNAQFRYNFGVNTGYYDELGAILMGLGNEYLSWQSVYKANIGLDAVFLREKLDFRVEYYVENTRNALSDITLAPSSGFSQYTENLGRIQNTGFEYSLRYKLLKNTEKGLLWSVNINGFTNSNVLKELSNKFKASNAKQDEANEEQLIPNPIYKEGQSMNTIYAVRSLGIDPATGSEVFLTKDGANTFLWDASDKVAVGINQPKWNGNFGTNLSYKGFDLNLIFNYQFGGQLYNQTLVDRVEGVDVLNNVDRRAYDLGWKGPGDVSMFRRITRDQVDTKVTSRFVQDDNNLSLTSASFGYNFYRNAFLKRWGMRSLQITAITNELFRISSIDIERGTSNPFARTYSLSLRVGF